MKRILSIALALILTLSAAAFVSASAEEITLSLWGWQGELEDAWMNNLVPDFEAENPGVKVELVLLPWGQYWQKVQTSMISNTLPDLLIMSVAYVDAYAANGALIDLGPYIDRDLDESLYFESGLKTVRCPEVETGSEYAFPWNVVGNCLYYNKTIFDEAGVAYPDETWTWDDLRAAAEKLTKDTGDMATSTYGYSVTNGYTTVDSLIYAWGGEIVSADLTTCLINSEAAAAALEFQRRMIEDGISPVPAASGDSMNFASGRVAMELGGAWSLESYGDTTSFDWDIALLPYGPTGQRFTRAWSDSIAISANCEHVEEAWSFIKFMVGEKGQTAANLSGTRIPILKSAAVSDDWLQPGTRPLNKQLLVDSIAESSPLIFRGNWNEWNSAYESETFLALTGEKEIAQALEDAQISIQEILDNNL